MIDTEPRILEGERVSVDTAQGLIEYNAVIAVPNVWRD